ncbi:MAG: LacI family transcriptional regulator [Oscillospiraceae bacterium]|jgi:LacI family transcriptional regulator|nr:LacI family transcriptional regulator [Oscillospiraceae bacterium]
MSATIKQVAARAGVSSATVSKYLNGVPLKDKNQAAVRAAIREMGYTRNTMARGLRTKRSMTVGAVIFEFSNPYSATVMSEIENYISGHGYGIIVCESKTDASAQREKINFLLNKLVDGLIICPVGLTDEDLRAIPVPVVCIDQLADARACDYILGGNAAASFEATEHLIAFGHRDIGIICGPAELYTARERLAGVLAAHEKYGVRLRDEYIVTTGYEVESGYKAARKLIETANRPTAIFATNHHLTLGAVIALNEANINIPDDISFIGFDYLELANAVRPNLSIVVQPVAQIGVTAAEMLLGKMTGQKSGFDIIELPLNFIRQKSVKRIIGTGDEL